MATIKDVAEMAKVSTATVSYVINNSASVRPETRYRVMEAVRILGYRPNPHARSLVTNTNKALGIARTARRQEGVNPLSFDSKVDTCFFDDILRQVEHTAAAAGYQVMITTIYRDQDDVLSAFSGKTDGLLLVGGLVSSQVQEQLLSANLPVTLCGARSDVLDWVDIDSQAGICMATQDLLAKGHRRIALINGPEASQSSGRKLNGYLSAMKSAQAEVCEGFLRIGDFSAKSGYMQAEQLFSLPNPPTAILTASDKMALGVLRYMYTHHYLCPSDCSVIGYGDGLLASHACPGLTTVSMQHVDLGALSCDTLLRRIRVPNGQHARLLIKPTMIERDSVLPLNK